MPENQCNIQSLRNTVYDYDLGIFDIVFLLFLHVLHCLIWLFYDLLQTTPHNTATSRTSLKAPAALSRCAWQDWRSSVSSWIFVADSFLEESSSLLAESEWMIQFFWPFAIKKQLKPYWSFMVILDSGSYRIETNSVKAMKIQIAQPLIISSVLPASCVAPQWLLT